MLRKIIDKCYKRDLSIEKSLTKEQLDECNYKFGWSSLNIANNFAQFMFIPIFALFSTGMILSQLFNYNKEKLSVSLYLEHYHTLITVNKLFLILCIIVLMFYGFSFIADYCHKKYEKEWLKKNQYKYIKKEDL